MSVAFCAHNLSLSRAGKDILSNISFTAQSGELIGLIGANGAGKSSLLQALAGVLPTKSGQIDFAGKPLLTMAPSDRPKYFAYCPQSPSLAWPMDVAAIVELAVCLTHADPKKIKERTEHWLEKCQLSALAARPSNQLSGGELARLHLARTLASDAPCLILDEPFAAMDIAHQFWAFDLLADYTKNGGTVMIAIHDLGMAARHADRLLLLGHGMLLMDGSPINILTDPTFEQAMGLCAHWHEGQDAGGFTLSPIFTAQNPN